MAKTELAKTYDPHQVEARQYRFWRERGYFRPPAKADRPDSPAFCITIPPPNVTGSLHIGHALQHSIHDCIARWRRMCGDRVLVVPGTDHAAISTNMKVEQALAEEGISRRDIGRDGFLERCWEWTRHYGGQIIKQLQALGCSYDWDRERFTLDERYYRAVLEAFVRFYRRGWIYRGHRVVNWCPTCASTVSDLEVNHRDQAGHLWHIRYPLADGEGDLVVATTRPETMLGDTAVAVHSQDPRHAGLVGREVMLPLMNRKIPVIADDVLVDPEFGTGAVKVTPAHDPNDFEAGQRNRLPSIVVIGPDARMTEEAGPYAGLDRFEARKRIIADLEAQGFLVKVEDYTYSVGEHDRCHTVLEPLLSEQWFLQMDELARAAEKVIRDGDPQITYLPERFRRYTLQWLENLRDWNISRQIWWGHRIPVYTCTACRQVMVSVDPPKSCEKCGGVVEQDPDTLDTWFSSALWPFAVLGWPDEAELRKHQEEGFYPTSLMITARDILYLWIVRMVMTSLEFTGEIPFRQVLVHPTVLNLEGRRMSKSLGTGVDPLELIERYGADATRFSLLFQCASDQDIRFGEQRTEMARNFCNKIWNAARFVLMNLGDDFRPAEDVPALVRASGSLAERWILSRCRALLETLESSLGRYEMAQAARALRSFFWSEFCDWFVEMCKPALRRGGEEAARARQVLWFVLESALRALHPFMPFITEEIWQQLPGSGEALMVAPWPASEAAWRDEAAEEEMSALMEIVVAGRASRARSAAGALSRAGEASLLVSCASDRVLEIARAHQEQILFLTGCGRLEVGEVSAEDPLAELSHPLGVEAVVKFAASLSPEDRERLRAQLQKTVARLRKEEQALQAKLDNPNFTTRAPAEVVERARERLAQVTAERQAAESQLESVTRL